MSADTIHLTGLRIAAWIGVPPDERAHPQALEVSLELVPVRGLTGLGDDLAHTVDYHAVAEQVTAVALEKKRRLIETLAEDIADSLLATHPLRRVAVEVRKFILPHCDHVSVRLSKGATD